MNRPTRSCWLQEIRLIHYFFMQCWARSKYSVRLLNEWINKWVELITRRVELIMWVLQRKGDSYVNWSQQIFHGGDGRHKWYLSRYKMARIHFKWGLFQNIRRWSVSISVYVSQWNFYYPDSYLNTFLEVLFADFFLPHAISWTFPLLWNSQTNTLYSHQCLWTFSSNSWSNKNWLSPGGTASPGPSQVFANLFPSSFRPFRDEIK